MVSGQDLCASGQGFQQLLINATQQVIWACSATLVWAVADKLRNCVHQAANESHGMQRMQQWNPRRLSSRNKSQHGMGLVHGGSALDVLRDAWDVLSADDALFAAAQHSSTLLSSVKRWLSVETQISKQDLEARTLLMLLNISVASTGLQVCCGASCLPRCPENCVQLLHPCFHAE
jgi:sulfur transfer complex TusBCD TusB component (DsrH family)